MKWRYLFLLLVFLFSACNPTVPQATATVPAVEGTPQPAPSQLPTAVSKVTSVPDAKAAAESYLGLWQKFDYAGMYALLSSAARAAVTVEAFSQHYQQTAINLTVESLETQLLTGQTDPVSAKMVFRVVYHTALFKDLERQNELNLALENGEWRVQWDEGLPFPELRGGNQLSVELTVPERGSILDRNNQVLAGNGNAVALSLVPGNIVAQQEGTLLQTLGDLVGRLPGSIRNSYKNAGPDWYIPVGDVSAEALDAKSGLVNNLEGIQQWPYGPTRFYPFGGIGPHVTGYVTYIPKEQLDVYRQQGYRRDEKIGASGLESWGQDTLTGQRGASLYLVNSSGQQINRLAQVEEAPPQNIVTTIDQKLQSQAQLAIREFTGAIVVMERDTGRVLALVSSPGFNPNLFDANNRNSQMGALAEMLNDPDAPLVNRATGDQASGYPLGSVFKIITLSAALESGLFTPEMEYDCQYEFNEIIGRTYYDWTLAKEKPPSGVLTLPFGLVRSCNPWFYHIGLTLFQQGRGKDIANMARAFGLGQTTGIEQLPEIAGNVPEPNSEVEAVEQAIGQDKLLVTPLQVARFVAAVGNGGTLYRPQVVEKLVSEDGTETPVFKPEAQGKLPLKEDNLKLIQQAMRDVVDHERGTAYDVMGAFRIPVYGKTGTAQSCEGCEPYAWFAAYTDMPNSSLPPISVAVVCEKTGEGSEIAAPIARRVIEIYYLGKLLNLYPWEESFNVRATEPPTPEPGSEEATETPQP